MQYAVGIAGAKTDLTKMMASQLSPLPTDPARYKQYLEASMLLLQAAYNAAVAPVTLSVMGGHFPASAPDQLFLVIFEPGTIHAIAWADGRIITEVSPPEAKQMKQYLTTLGYIVY